jgi:ferredoxin
MTLIPVIDPYACSAHGDCVDLAPTVFTLEGDVAEVIGTGPDDQIVNAARSCPASAISIVDATGAQVYP